MKYLFVANQIQLQGYTEFCNGTYLALLCETKRNEYSSLPNEYIRSEQLYFLKCQKQNNGFTKKDFTKDDFNILVMWDRTALAKILTYLGFTPRIVILSELLGTLTSNYINSFEYNLCIHCVLQRQNYPSNFTVMKDFIPILKHEIELPELVPISEIERILTNNYLQNRVQSGVICTFSPAIVPQLEDFFENSKLIDKLFTSSTYYFLQDLKSLYFISKLRITTFLWENYSKRTVIQKELGVIHLLECEAVSQSQLGQGRPPSAGGICFSPGDSSFSPASPNKVIIYKSIISLFDGYTLCEKCKEKLTGIYNSVSEFNYNERIVKNFCDKNGYTFNTKSNGNFEIITGVSEWFLDIAINSSKVTNLFHKNIFEGGSYNNKGKKRKMSKNGYHKQHVNYKNLIYILNYIHVHDEAREEEKQRLHCNFISEKFIQKRFIKIGE